MAASSRLGRQLEEVAVLLNRLGVKFALIGGLALASHKVVRATQDVDLLIDASSSSAIDSALSKLGYVCLHRSGDAGNYVRGDERLDFIYAVRPAALKLLSRAAARKTVFGVLNVVSIEGLIGLKLQGWVNDPRRTQDLEDIRALLRANREAIDFTEVREYFALFGREKLLEELLHEPE